MRAYVFEGYVYNPSRRYLGPQDSWLCRFIDPFPDGMEVLNPAWNRAAFRHDVRYSGKWPWYKRLWVWLTRPDPRRAKADADFHKDLSDAVIYAERVGDITSEQATKAQEYAYVVYSAVSYFGAAFYKKGELNNANN